MFEDLLILLFVVCIFTLGSGLIYLALEHFYGPFEDDQD